MTKILYDNTLSKEHPNIQTIFTNAVLEGAFATNSKFQGAIVEGADFTDVIMRPDTEAYLCEIASGTNPVTGRNTHDTLFCK